MQVKDQQVYNYDLGIACFKSILWIILTILFGWATVWSILISQTLFDIPTDVTTLLNEYGIILFCCVVIASASFDYILSEVQNNGWKVACVLASLLAMVFWFYLFNPNLKTPPKIDAIRAITIVYCIVAFLYCFILKCKLFYIERLNKNFKN